ncbi:MAG: NADH-quinone oxidoreductase subunit C [Xanthomonadaceae bacterium]|nr:NADH-quinone oxidoreductase subunit C [Xanthomonadaceae bacterium]
MSGYAGKLAAALAEHFGDKLLVSVSAIGEVTAVVDQADLVSVATTLRNDDAFRFEECVDVCGVDYASYGNSEWATERATRTGFSRGVDRDAVAASSGLDPSIAKAAHPRFAAVYHLLSVSKNRRLRLRAFCADDEVPMVPTVTGVWPGANWFEREAFDLFGILFDGHPDLRRILTDYGFIGHPFRKDFPLIGNAEVRYDPERQRVVYEPVSIQPRTLVPRVIRDDHRYDAEVRQDKPSA